MIENRVIPDHTIKRREVRLIEKYVIDLFVLVAYEPSIRRKLL